jgi:hypothetical protein
MKKTIAASTAFAAVLAFSACTRTPPAAPESPFVTAASIQEIMAGIVDPSADALWESVSTETTAKGTVERQPRSDAEWAAVRQHALHLIEAGNLLAIEGRAVTHSNKLTEDSHVDGIAAPADISKAIAQDRPAFLAHARALQDAAAEALLAVDTRNPAKLMLAGGKLDQACEHCHVAYWYPRAKGADATRWPAPVKP